MKLHPYIIGLTKFVSEYSERPQIQGVYICGPKGKAYATDGAIAVAVPLNEETPLDVIVPATLLNRIPAAAKDAILEIQEGTCIVRFALNGSIAGQLSQPAIAGPFPDVEKVIPAKDRRVHFSLRAGLYKDLLDYIVKSAGEDASFSFWTSPDAPLSTIRIEFATAAEGHGTATTDVALAPLRVYGEDER